MNLIINMVEMRVIVVFFFKVEMSYFCLFFVGQLYHHQMVIREQFFVEVFFVKCPWLESKSIFRFPLTSVDNKLASAVVCVVMLNMYKSTAFSIARSVSVRLD
jgi:hypothetical protein